MKATIKQSTEKSTENKNEFVIYIWNDENEIVASFRIESVKFGFGLCGDTP